MKIATIVGARPQFIKAATVSRVVRNNSRVRETIIHTGQHFDANMSDIFFDELDIPRPDYNLGIGGGSHGQNTGRMIEAIEQLLIKEKPDWVMVYGDTDSTLAGALAAVKLHTPVAHVEAGLRSFNRRMPEEVNRVLTDHAASLLFAPTTTAVENLKNEGITGVNVHKVGDVMYDATLYYRNHLKKPDLTNLPDDFVVCTIHRAENVDDSARLSMIIAALNDISRQVPVLLPIHPRTRRAMDKLNFVPLHSGLFLIDPVGFLEMYWLLANCRLVMTDSGGLQKEAFFHHKPCVILRDETEWVELLDLGACRLASASRKDIISVFDKMIDFRVDGRKNVFGTGHAAELIMEKLYNH